MFITLEGIDGSGKTTQVQLLADFLRKNTNKKVLTTREPGGTEVAEKIREILFLPKLADHLTELFLYLAARRDHFLNTIKPLLDNDEIVICDRFVYSTLAYQGYGFGVDVDLIKQLHNIILPEKHLPDFTFILDVNPDIAIKRAKQESIVKYENALGKEFFDRVSEGFIKLSQDPNCHLIDASKSIPEVHVSITKIISNSAIIFKS